MEPRVYYPRRIGPKWVEEEDAGREAPFSSDHPDLRERYSLLVACGSRRENVLFFDVFCFVGVLQT